MNLLSFFFNTVTIWVLIYFLINRCTGITVKWVLHTCTSKLERKKGTVHIYKHLLCFYMYFCCNCNCNAHTRLQYSFAEVLSYIYYLIKQLSKYLRQKQNHTNVWTLRFYTFKYMCYTSLHQFEKINRKYCIFLIFPSLLNSTVLHQLANI